jgi:acyl-CoA thioester hydrolase
VPHRFQLKVRFYELDPYGHLNHSAFVQFFEVGRVELLDDAGLGLDEFSELGYQFVVTNIETAFEKSVMAGDVLTVETEVLEIRRASSRWRQRLLRDDEVVARQLLRAAITDTAGKPVRAPASLSRQLAPYMAEE